MRFFKGILKNPQMFVKMRFVRRVGWFGIDMISKNTLFITVWLWSPMWPTSSKIEDVSASDSLWILNVSERLCSGKVGRWSRGYYNFWLSVRVESYYYLFWYVKMMTIISFDVYSRSTRVSRMSPIRTFSGFSSICNESDDYSFSS